MTIELARPAIEQARRCALYRHFDVTGVLLYVGITDSLEGRTSGHARTSDWVRFAFSAEATWLDSREEAAEAEQQAIRDEGPIFNRQHAIGDVDRRVADYVRDREIQNLKDDVATYEGIVKDFLDAMPPAALEEALAWADHDYRAAGQVMDRTFSAHVLRHATAWFHNTGCRARDEGRAEAWRETRGWLADQLKALDERQDARGAEPSEPPF